MFGVDFGVFAEIYLPKIIVGAIIFVIGFIAIKVILKVTKKLLFNTKIERTASTFFISALRIVLFSILLLTVLSTAGVNVSSIVAAVGAAALAAGFALQNTLSNIASGIIILLSKPFVAGDILQFNGQKGRVESIRIFTTIIHTLDNKIMTIPNSLLTSQCILNCTMNDSRRLDLNYTVSYDDDIHKVKEVILDVVSKNDKIITEPEPAVYVGEHLESGIQIITQIWVDPDDYYSVYYYMQENVKLAFDENNITIPYPHIVVKNK
ncbi:MAG: mechanosensitive ion channel [Ruminococcus sp.]|nr:mechanosensitive ion channel [Ruminococcus sp.]